MRIEFERTGGFAGVRLTAALDTAALPPDEAADLEALVAAAGFFGLPPALAAARRQPDRFHYRLRVTARRAAHAVEVDEEALPPALRPLVERLTAAALAKPA